jgi:O-antigen/teichoic acid export membrane protein
VAENSLTRQGFGGRRQPRSVLSIVQVGANIGILAGQVALRAGTLVLLAAVLGPAGQGTLTLAVTIATLGSAAASVGLDTAVTREAALGIALDEIRFAVRRHAAVISIVAITVGVVGVVVGFDDAVVAGFFCLGGNLVVRLHSALALGEGRVMRFALLSLLPYAANLSVLVILCAVGSLDVKAALVVTVVTTGLTPLALLFARKVARRGPANLYRIAFSSYPGALAQITNYRFDQLIIGIVLSRASLGLYSFAVAASELTTIPAQGLANVILPKSRQGKIHFRRTVTAAWAAMAIPFFSPPAFLFLVDELLPTYHSSSTAFLVLVPAAAAMAGTKVTSAWTTGVGSPWLSSRVALITSPILIGLDLFLIPLAGIVGAATASAVAYSLALGLMWRAATSLRSGPVTG